MVFQKRLTGIICQTATIPRWIYGTLRATARRTKSQQRKTTVEVSFSGFDKVFSPPSLILRFSKAFTVASQFMHREKTRLAQLQETEGLTTSSRDKVSRLPTRAKKCGPEVLLHDPGSTFLPLAGGNFISDDFFISDDLSIPDDSSIPDDFSIPDDLFIPDAAVDLLHDPDPFPTTADLFISSLPQHHQSQSVSDRSDKKARTREYLEKEERDIGFYEGAMRGGREGAYAGGHDPKHFPPPTDLSIPGARVPYHHQSHSESDRPVKKARTKYDGDIENSA